MVLRLSALLLLITLFTGAGGHLAMMQSFAWLQMIRERATNQKFFSLIQSVFSGEKPCSLCHTVQKLNEKQKQQEQHPIASPQWIKTEALIVARPTFHIAPRNAKTLSYPIPKDHRFFGYQEAPPTPPPKA